MIINCDKQDCRQCRFHYCYLSTGQVIPQVLKDVLIRNAYKTEPVVRCKDCDSYVEVAWWFDDEGKKKECHCCVAHSIAVQPNDFCSYGERREP